MVCTNGMGRMAAMVRLLANGNYPEITAEEASHEKLAARSIHREWFEADEANLLDEEDMHVYDCKPMEDPLHLVCCNSCKKPVKASQYAAHAERCRSLNYREDFFLELDGGTGHKKPPRKGRKKFQTAHENQVTTIRGQERSGSIDGDDTAASESKVNDQTGMTMFYREAKGNSASIDGFSVMDGSVVSPGSATYLAGVMSPSEKRTKLYVRFTCVTVKLRISPEHPLMSEGPERAFGITTNIGINFQEALTYPPVPLATKIYHSQRNHRLRSALSHVYHEASTKEHFSDHFNPQLTQGNVMLPSQLSSPKNIWHELQADDLPQKKKDAYVLPAVRKPDHILAQSLELCLGNSGGYPLAKNFSKPALSVDTASMRVMRNKYLQTAYSFPGNSGTSLGSMQQPNESVPVI